MEDSRRTWPPVRLTASSRCSGSTAGSEKEIFLGLAYGFFVYMGGNWPPSGLFPRYVTVDTVRRPGERWSSRASSPCSLHLFFMVGTALYVYYQQSHVEIYEAMNSGRGRDQLLPHFVINFSGGYGMTGLILAGLFAAA
ncbi:MAG: hypothetical protein CM1200mP2_59660 [Planctomycetaceae bacterium]|nr:MAG: hypothetical protein CM1200mP2_59660 [Planctomycetaceae bacterium]